MSLTSRQIVRLLIGDTQEPYVMTDDEVDYYLTINDDNTDDAAQDASAAMAQILAVRAIDIKTAELEEDRTKVAQSYLDSLDKASQIKSSSVYPIIGGADTYPGPSVNEFDTENDYDSDNNTFYNEYETESGI